MLKTPCNRLRAVLLLAAPCHPLLPRRCHPSMCLAVLLRRLPRRVHSSIPPRQRPRPLTCLLSLIS